MARDQQDSVWPFVFGLLAGLAGGTVAGLLLAPKSGDEFREDIQNSVRNLPETLNNEFSNPSGNARQFIDRTRYNIEARVDRAKREREAERLAKAKREEELASGYEYGQ